MRAFANDTRKTGPDRTLRLRRPRIRPAPRRELAHLLGNQGAQRQGLSAAIQAGRRVNRPGDGAEREADRVADAVMRMPAPRGGRTGGPPCVRCAAEASGRAPAGPHTAASADILAGLGSGRPLDAHTRAFFEPRFGRDFSGVRIHADARAAASARSVDAQAYTVGRDVVFGADRFAPHTSTGRQLLAHELAHVTQQQSAPAPQRGLIQRRLLVDDPTGTPAAAPSTQTHDTIVNDYLSVLCPDFVVNAGVVEPLAGFCLVGAASATPESCDCLCEMHGLATDWTIKVDDNDWPHTDPATQTVTVHSPFSGVEFGQWAVGPPTHRATIPNWLVLGHELCGHARLFARGTHPTGPAPTHGGRPSHDVTVAIQNVIASEHGIPADELRGLFADPHHGESIAKVTVAEFPFGSADVSRLPASQQRQLDIAEAFINSAPVMMDVIGHADRPARSAADNAAISRERAENVKSELEGRAIDASRFLAVDGVADTECAASGRQPSCRKVDIFMFILEGGSVTHP